MVIKFIFDRLMALIGLLVLWPVLLVVAVLIRIKMPGGSVIFTQKRVGRNGRLFTMYKFRSMTVGHGGSSVSVAGESRITPLGAKLRHYKLDELPELWNVLIGDMSFVGPRPERPEFVEKNCKEIPEFAYRMKVKAGLTGYAQVYGKYNTSFLDKLKLDLLYIEKYSVLMDVQIILMTLKIILMKDSAEGISE